MLQPNKSQDRQHPVLGQNLKGVVGAISKPSLAFRGPLQALLLALAVFSTTVGRTMGANSVETGDQMGDIEALKKLALSSMNANLDAIVTMHAEVIEEEVKAIPSEIGGWERLQQERKRLLWYQRGKWRQDVKVWNIANQRELVYQRQMTFDGSESRKLIPARSKQSHNIGIIEADTIKEMPPSKDFKCGYRIFHSTSLESLINSATEATIESDGVKRLLHLKVPDEGGTFDVWLSVDEGFLIVKMIATDSLGRLAAERTNVTTERIGKAWFITEMKEVIFARDGSQHDIDEVRHVSVTHIDVDPLDKGLFSLAFPDNTLVKNRIDGSSHLVGESALEKSPNATPSARRHWILGATALAVLLLGGLVIRNRMH